MHLLRTSGLPHSAASASRKGLASLSARSGYFKLLLALLATTMVLGSASRLEAATCRQKAHGKTGTRPSSSRASANAKSKTEAEEAKIASKKVAVFAFEGDDSEPLRKHVIQALSDRGLRVETTLKPLDTAEQYRDMGATLNLASYVHGRIKDTNGEHAVATVVIRSAVTGRKLATATFNGFRRGLPFDVEENLWKRVGPALVHACVEASKPGRRHNEPMRIEAGTPL